MTWNLCVLFVNCLVEMQYIVHIYVGFLNFHPLNLMHICLFLFFHEYIINLCVGIPWLQNAKAQNGKIESGIEMKMHRHSSVLDLF